MVKIYLDSSAIVKRYIFETGSSAMDYLFDRSWAGEVSIASSLWNIGEVLGVLDERRRRGWLDQSEYKKTLESFVGETVRLTRLKVLELFPVSTPILVESWPLILDEGVYEADALQIRTCMHSDSNAFLSSDKELISVALKTGLKAINVEDEEKVKDLLHEGS